MRERLAALVTIVALIGFTILAIYLLRRVSSPELGWSRRVYVFSAVEAIAFAAVGWLFGKEVHREQAQAAEQRASNAESRADQAGSEAIARAQDAAANRQRAEAAERRAGRFEDQTMTLTSQLGERREDVTRYRERARVLKQAILSAREQPRPPLSMRGVAAAERAAVPSELDALADLAQRIHPED